MAAIVIRDVEKAFGSLRVIHGINVDVADGEFVVLVGPSGCGKSTLLRMIAGLENISAGTISIGGRVVNTLPPKDRDVAMVFQNYALYPHMTVHDNMAFSLKLRNADPRLIGERVQKGAGILNLTDYLKRYPRQLSGGQRQRVAMGRAIVRDPQVFLFDEPLSNLDAKLRVQMRVEIKKLQQSLATTSIYVTHDQVEAMTLADRLVVMNGGRAEQIGPPIELYERPATQFVAGFIGSPAMNFVPGEIVAGGIHLAGGALLSTAIDAAPGTAVTVGLRPEHLETAAGGPIVLDVDLVEMLGADTIVHGTLGGVPLLARLPGTVPVRVGERIPLAVMPSQIHLFDKTSGKRI